MTSSPDESLCQRPDDSDPWDDSRNDYWTYYPFGSIEIKTIVWMISCLHLKSKFKMDKSYLLNVKIVSRETL